MVSVMMIMAVASVRANIATEAYVVNAIETATTEAEGNLSEKQDILTSTNVTSSGSGVVKTITADGGLTITKQLVATGDITTTEANKIQGVKFANGAVTSDKIANGAITNDKINDDGDDLITMEMLDWPSQAYTSGGVEALTIKSNGNGGWTYQWENIDNVEESEEE